MPKPGSRTHTPSDEMARFTNREGQQATFQRHLQSANEPQVLVFYGVGGTGKTWLLKKLREQVPDGIPSAYLDFDVSKNGKRYVDDHVTVLQSIKEQLSVPTPRFDLALAMLHKKRGHVTESGSGVPWLDIAGDIVSSSVPGAGPVLKMLSKSALVRLEGTSLEKLLRTHFGKDLVIALRRMTDQEIENSLLGYLSEDLAESLPTHLNRAVKCVIFLDTFESIGAGFENKEHKRSREECFQNLAAKCGFALVVIAGQNRLSWDENPEWAEYLDQHLVGGLSEGDARQFLTRCDITAEKLQDCILATSKESTGGYHCFSLGLCANIVVNERNAGSEPEAETLRFKPQDWDQLARRFLKSLDSDTDCIWIEQLALTPRFDETAARHAYSPERSTAQAAAWRKLRGYSFVERLSDSEWYSIRSEMRAALRNQPSAQERLSEDHRQWRDYWSSRSEAVADDAAGLAWYHSYYLNPVGATKTWKELAENARTSRPARMREHSGMLGWLEPLQLLENTFRTKAETGALWCLGQELSKSSFKRGSNLQRAIACFEAVLCEVTEEKSPQHWGRVKDNLGGAWREMPTGDHTANLNNSIASYEAALRVFTEQDFPQKWAMISCNLGMAWRALPTGDCTANVRKAIVYYEAALRVLNEHEFPSLWANAQNSLGIAWAYLARNDAEPDFMTSITCYEAALRVLTEQDFPQNWAMIQNNLASVWDSLPTGDRTANLKNSIACYEAALRVFTEQDFPQNWAMVQNGLGRIWNSLPTGDRAENLKQSINCYTAALRVSTEQEFPKEWAGVQNNLGRAWGGMPTGDRTTNLKAAIDFFEAALRIFTEQDFPQDWANVQTNLGRAWERLPTGDRTENVRSAVSYFEAAQRVYTKQSFPRDYEIVVAKLKNLAELGIPK